MLSAMSDHSVLGSVTLVASKAGAEFLAEREVADLLADTCRVEPDSDVTEVDGAAFVAGALGELTSPSLFASVRALVVRGLDQLPDDVHAPLLAYAASPQPDVVLVLVHPGGQKGSGLLTKLKKVPAVRTVSCEPPKAWERSRFVVAEVRRMRGQIDPDAAEHLADAVGEDLRALSGAVGQLVHDFEGQRLTAEIVGRYFEGRSEVKGYEIADLAIDGQTERALERLRQARSSGLAEVLVVSAFASGLRSLARLQSARGVSEPDLPREIGVPPFKVRAMRAQLKAWDPAGLVRALHSVAAADLDVKGGAGDSDFALERMVLRVVAARGAR